MFKTVDSDMLVGNCPFCHSKEAFKFKEGSKWMFLCHDCQRYMPFENAGIKEHETITPDVNFNNLLSYFTRVDRLDVNHPARRYAETRKIPLSSVYYTDSFDTLSDKYAETPVKDNKRLCFLIYNTDKKLVGVTGRSLNPKDKLRYITLMFDKNESKVYGKEKINMEKPFVVVEGPLDSLFVKNAIAMNGAEGIENKYSTFATICFDNEPRNKQIVNKMKRSLENNFKVVIWPKSLKHKDINDMVLAGYDPDKIIAQNTYSGLLGQLKLNEWKK